MPAVMNAGPAQLQASIESAALTFGELLDLFELCLPELQALDPRAERLFAAASCDLAHLAGVASTWAGGS